MPQKDTKTSSVITNGTPEQAGPLSAGIVYKPDLQNHFQKTRMKNYKRVRTSDFFQFSVYHTIIWKARNEIILLLLVEIKNNHNCLIKNFSNLIHFLTRSKVKQGKGPEYR